MMAPAPAGKWRGAEKAMPEFWCRPFSTSPAELASIPELLAGELAESLAVDPLECSRNTI